MSDPARDDAARTLRTLREDAGLTLVDVAARVGVSQSSLTRYEQGRFAVPEQVLAKLVELYRPDRETRRRLLGGAREKQPRYKRIVMHRGARAAQVRIGQIERDSVRQHTFTPTVVPGLLQTERYMRALAGSGLAPGKVDGWVQARLDRQRILDQPGHEFEQIITAGALLWGLGGREVMLEQLDRLADLTAHPAISLGVIPPSAAVEVVPLHAFDVYEDERGRRQVIFSTHGGLVTITDEQGVAEYMSLLERLRPAALSGDDARRVLGVVARHYRRPGL